MWGLYTCIIDIGRRAWGAKIICRGQGGTQHNYPKFHGMQLAPPPITGMSSSALPHSLEQGLTCTCTQFWVLVTQMLSYVNRGWYGGYWYGCSWLRCGSITETILRTAVLSLSLQWWDNDSYPWWEVCLCVCVLLCACRWHFVYVCVYFNPKTTHKQHIPHPRQSKLLNPQHCILEKDALCSTNWAIYVYTWTFATAIL